MRDTNNLLDQQTLAMRQHFHSFHPHPLFRAGIAVRRDALIGWGSLTTYPQPCAQQSGKIGIDLLDVVVKHQRPTNSSGSPQGVNGKRQKKFIA